jgi:hypothetical protein
MFVEAELAVPLPYGVAKDALDRAVADGGLVAESHRAVDEGLVFLMPVGPRGSHGPAKDVLVRFLPAHQVGGRYVLPLRWEVTGPTGSLFPTLDGNLELVAGGEAVSRLSIVASYDPPLGRLGATIDRAGMSRIASATMTALLREVASQLVHWARLPNAVATPPPCGGRDTSQPAPGTSAG